MLSEIVASLFAFALIHELLRTDRIDLDYLVRYANAHWLVIRNPGGADDGLFARDARVCVLDPHGRGVPGRRAIAATGRVVAGRA